jgi:hypothetical protein
VDILNLETNSIPLSTSYSEDDNLKFIGFKNNTEEGFSFFQENYLKNTSDRKINNYSSIYLTDKQKISDFLTFNKLEKDENLDLINFTTSLIDSNTNYYITLSTLSGFNDAVDYLTTYDQKYVEPTSRIFELVFIDDAILKVKYRNLQRLEFYLNYYNNNVYFSLTSILSSNIFNYIIDKKGNKLSLFKTSQNGVSSVVIQDKNLTLITTTNVLNNYFIINYYIQSLDLLINTSWVSYFKEFKNSYIINPQRSRKDIKNNYMLYSQYSYVDNTLNSNILTLKNQKTHKNYSYRSDFIEKTNPEVPNVDNRTYYSLFTGNDQEKGDYKITTGYEFYNLDYKFLPDTYNMFTTPESLYPYKQININDLKWEQMGSIAGDNPYYSDRMYQRKSQENSERNSEYLCSWLYRNRKGEHIWLDRYYYPTKTSFLEAFKTSFNYTFLDPSLELFNRELKENEYYDVPFVYNSYEGEDKNTPQTIRSAIYGRSFYDKRSDIVILPNSDYIYYRIGDNYVDTIINSLSSLIIENGLSIKDGNDGSLYVDLKNLDDFEFVFDNNKYAMLDNYKDVNDTHQFTINFWIQSDDWTKKFGYQIFGNLNQKGIGLLDDRKITPFITIQNDNQVFVYNTDFNLVNTASLKNESYYGETMIRDLYRTDHLDCFGLITTEKFNIIID